MPQDGLREHGKVKLNRETGYCSLIAEDETEGKAKAFMSNFLFKAFSSTNAKIPKAVMDCLHYQVDSLMMQYDILLSLPFLSSQAPSSQLLTLWSRSGIHESFGEHAHAEANSSFRTVLPANHFTKVNICLIRSARQYELEARSSRECQRIAR